MLTDSISISIIKCEYLFAIEEARRSVHENSLDV